MHNLSNAALALSPANNDLMKLPKRKRNATKRRVIPTMIRIVYLSTGSHELVINSLATMII